MATEEDGMPAAKGESPAGRLETTISLRIGEWKTIVEGKMVAWVSNNCSRAGEAKGLPGIPSGRPRDVYVRVTLDQEEILRTSIIEKTLK